MARRAAAVLVLCLLTGAEYLDRRHDDVYRRWRGLRYGCRCDPAGSVSTSCDIRTGQCTCHPYVTGDSCDRCQTGSFGLRPGVGCRPCDCDRLGSLRDACDPVTGQCRCKPGVAGARCSACLPGYFRLSETGCQECGPCDQPRHRCDPDTGRCTCPPHTQGATCSQCTPGYWGQHRVEGCQSCDCDTRGSVSSDCNPVTGHCRCFFGFGGRRCDRCALGSYDFPRCRRCHCDPAGSAQCDRWGNCACDDDGRCRCKRNVVGERCDRCAADSFGFSADNPDGCTTCFCFTRSGQCSQAEFSWAPLTLPDDRAVTLTPGQSRLNVTNSLRVIPGRSGDVTLGLSFPFDAPIYWQLPEEFLGDKVRSYNGELRFRVHNTGGSRPFPDAILASYPLVQLQGNDRLVLEHYPDQPASDGLHAVRFHETQWRRKGDARTPVTREMLMVALQNTQHVLIRATESLDVRRAEISDISWDIAEPTFGRPGAPALGIERCACPGRYNGSSCQDPSIGFYRIQRHEYQSSEIIIELVGEVVPCQCNGRATTCDPETGICLNCTGNTAGRRCDLCAPGYYGDPLAGACRRCLCPTEEVSHAFGCSAYYGSFRCQCKPGYAGERCDRCAYGYYGDARDPAAGCVPCGCDRTGSVSQRCDPVSGQCLCRAGLLGRTCSGCPARHALTDNGCQECSDTCVQLLFEEVDELTEEVTTVNVTRTVGAPWRRLFQLSNTTEQYEDDFSDYIQTQLTLKALYDSLDLTNFANTILIRTRDLMSTFPALTNNTRDLRDQIKAINESVEASRKEAEDIVAELLRYARGETPAVSVEQALADVRAILELMQKRNFSEAQERAEAELAAARRLLERVGGFGVNRTAHQVVSSRLEEMRRRLLDMQQLMEEQVRRPVRKANVLLEELMDGLDSLSAGRQQVQSEAEQCEGVLANTTELQTRLYRLYDQAQGHGIDLSDIQLELSLANASLQKRLTTLANLTDDFRVRYVIPAEVHADRLTTEAERLVGLFQATRQGANLSLNAAQAYQDIVDALAAARTAAEEASSAAQTAYRQAYPADTDSLVSLGTQTKTRSEELLKAAEVVKRQVVELSEKLAASRERLQRINGTLDKVAAVDQDVRLQLQTLDDIGVTEAARGAANRSQAALAASELVLSRVEAVQAALETELRPGLRRLQQAGADGIGNASRTVDEARKSLTKADLRALDVEMKAADVEALSDGVGLKLQNLKNKILKARQAASNIRVSLTGEAASGACTRTYRAAELQPSTTSSVRLNYAVSDEAARDALLFYLAADRQKDFMAIEMVNRTIRFLWNNGGQTQMVDHPQRLDTNDEQLLSDSSWYIINAERIGNLGRLSVRPVYRSDVGRKVPDTVTAVSTAGFSVMDLTSDDPVYIGGLPDGASRSVTTKRFAGCLDRAVLNGQPIGLWNFRSSDGCGACRVGPSDDKLVTSPGYSFDGAGYAELPPLRPGQVAVRGMYSVVMNVRTFDSDALLFLAVNAEKDQFFSLEMRNGNLVSRVGFSKEDVLVVSTNGKYNTGNWTMVEATKVGNRVILKANHDEDKESAFHPESSSDAPPRSFNLALDTAKLYFGGVPPDFRQSRWPQHTFVPLLGCMDDLQVGFTPQNLRVGNSTGVTPGCGGQLLKTVGFHGDGYLETNSYRLRKMSSFAFSFKTTASDGLLLMSTFADKAMADSAMLREYYALSLNASRLTLRINGGSGELVLTAADLFSDGRFHTVHVLKERRRVELRVADAVAASGQLPRGSSGVQAPNAGGLYFGGLPPGLRVPFEGVPPPFSGCITDVIFEEDLVLFDPPLRHQHVAIGRCNGDLQKGRMLHEMATEPDPTSCNQPSQLTLEARAVKFGDNPFSHVYVPIKKRDLRSDFNITLDFRTFYPNGLLLYNEGRGSARRPNASVSTLTLSLRDGAVVLNVQKGRRGMEFSTKGQLNDGDWKMVTLEKRRRRYTLRVSGVPVAKKRGPQTLRPGSALYIGGLPQEGVDTLSVRRLPGQKKLELLQTEGFKGCMKQLEVRGRVIDLPSRRNIIHRVGQCMARVELGTFFAGDAFATYDDSFQLGSIVELAVDFRTTELSGVLISVAGPPGGPALSLEITDGQVVFSVHNGGSEPIRARQKFPTKFTVCDNRWHSVKANYVRYQATLKVDRYPERYGFSANGPSQTPSGGFPLYIGGLPERASNSILLQPDNFKGCIRNIEINGVRRDWTDMAQLTNVLLNSCPVEV